MPERTQDKDSKGLARRLRSLRAARGLTVQALADEVGVSKVTIWKWERGASRPRRRMVASIARALGVDPSELDPGLTDLAALKRGGRAAGGGSKTRAPFRAPVTSPHQLNEVILKAKAFIARASGVTANQITVRIEF